MATALQESMLIVPQPDAKGEFVTPADGAKFQASFGIPQTPLDGKRPIELNWTETASTDFGYIDACAKKYPGCNFGSVSKAVPGGHYVLETDSREVSKAFKSETGNGFSSKLRIQSGPDRGHHWYLQSPESLQLSNVGQKTDAGFSLRWNNEQCVSPGSYHPVRKTQYRVVKPGPPSVATPEEINWLKSKVKVKAEPPIRNENNKIPHGAIHPALVSECGRLCAAGYSVESREVALLAWAHENCEAPIDENKVSQVARSSGKWERGNPAKSLVMFETRPAKAAPLASVQVAEAFDLDTSETAVKPIFPYWVMKDTTIFDGLVAPAVATSAKYSEFIFMAAVQVMLNFLFKKVRMKHQEVCFNLFLGYVSPYGKFFKSSSAQLAYNYFKAADILQSHSAALRSAEGKVITMQAGSPEGFGSAMATINGKNAILFNDELGHLVSKARIESSAFLYNLLSWYGSSSFENVIRSSKNSFSFEAGSYCFSWLFCTTDRGFNRLWPKLVDMSSGLVDRMFFVVSPDKPNKTSIYHDPYFGEAALATKKAIDAAIDRGVYDNENIEEVQERLDGLDPRSMQLVQALALYFCIDLQRDEVDSDCLERASALVTYRNQTTAFLAPIEADTQLGRLQKEIIREIQQHRGKMSRRDLCRNVDYQRYGTDLWRSGYNGLLKGDDPILAEWVEKSSSGQNIKMVGLLKQQD